MTLAIICPSRAESGPLASVYAALPDSLVIRFISDGMSPAVAVAQAMTYFTAAYRSQKITRVLCLGDRYETLAAALAALFVGIPVAHIHGGETTTGAFDDPMRHAITHISDLHFVAHESAGERVCELRGWKRHDFPKPVHLVGAPGLDTIPGGTATQSEKKILVTYHPETMAADRGIAGCRAMLTVLQAFQDHTVIFSPPNNDPGADEITAMIALAVSHNANWVIQNMARDSYIGALQSAAFVIGNSSAGIIECPWVGVPSVNIGRRQEGRPMAPSVFNWLPESEAPLMDVIASALAFRGYSNPFYTGGAAAKIAAVLTEAMGGKG